MSFSEVLNLCSDGDDGNSDVKPFKKEHVHGKIDDQVPILKNGSLNNGSAAAKVVWSTSGVSDQGSSVADASSPTSAPPGLSGPGCRKFWKAGEYDIGLASKPGALRGNTHLRVHPKFLHSNATSHKWAFGAIAELLDNAVDEIQNGGTFVNIDKTLNPRNGSQALLIQDDGGGMDPEALRRCMSFGFSEKSSKSSIGQYGNGFKTSTMRLGADAIVFTRCMGERVSTQSVGLLSYTFLTLTGRDDIVVPMVDYEFNPWTGELQSLLRHSKGYFSSNLSTLLQWSPYASEVELLKQFDDIGHHGTKVILYNLWLNDDGAVELDFESDAEDILISGGPKTVGSGKPYKMMYNQHYAIQFRYSLRVYSAILYLRLPETFRIILRGRVVEHHAIVNDLKFHEFILYKPHIAGKEVQIVTTIGFIREAPHVNIHGFNVYHKNRLILPFWRVVHCNNSKGRGVVGVFEANFIEPTHDKQGFEKTTLYNKLETRLRDMTIEYWDYHCGLVGYLQLKKSSPSVNSHVRLQPSVEPISPAFPGGVFPSSAGTYSTIDHREVISSLSSPSIVKSPTMAPAARHQAMDFDEHLQAGFSGKRKQPGYSEGTESTKRQAVVGEAATRTGTKNDAGLGSSTENQGAYGSLMQENKKLHAVCMGYEKSIEELQLKVQRLNRELRDADAEYARLLKDAQLEGVVKAEGV